LYQYATSYQSSNTFTVNGGPAISANAGTSTEPTKTATATASGAGELVFTFTRISHHAAFSGLSISNECQAFSKGWYRLDVTTEATRTGYNVWDEIHFEKSGTDVPVNTVESGFGQWAAGTGTYANDPASWSHSATIDGNGGSCFWPEGNSDTVSSWHMYDVSGGFDQVDFDLGTGCGYVHNIQKVTLRHCTSWVCSQKSTRGKCTDYNDLGSSCGAVLAKIDISPGSTGRQTLANVGTEALAVDAQAVAVDPNPAGFSANAQCTGSDGYLWASTGASCAFGNADGTPLEVDYTASTYTTYSFDMKMRNAPTNGGVYPHGGFKPCNLDGAGQSRGSSPEVTGVTARTTVAGVTRPNTRTGRTTVLPTRPTVVTTPG
jgi:hypothetical protein